MKKRERERERERERKWASGGAFVRDAERRPVGRSDGLDAYRFRSIVCW